MTRLSELDTADRDAIVLALAILALDRPGWYDYLRTVAEKLGSYRSFEMFHELLAPRFTPPNDITR